MCLFGHRWDPSPAEAALAATAAPLCPVCGAGVRESPDPHETVTLWPGGPLPDEVAEPATGFGPGAVEAGPAVEYPPRLPGYEVLAEAGRGGMVTVFRARQLACDRLVALKVFPAGPVNQPAALGRFRREVRLLARLDHPHVVPVYDAGESAGRPYYAMKLLEGGSLRLYVPELTADPVRAAGLLVRLAEAVQHAHDRGVVHRDLKPSNVLFDHQGEPYLCDFNIAWSAQDHAGEADAGPIIGTLAYMAPEQALGSTPTPAIDVYGLGAILYELLTGRRRFADVAALELIRLLQEAEPPRPRVLNPDCPAALEDICLRCLRKDPGERPAGAREVADGLRDFLSRAGKVVPQRPAPARPLTRPGAGAPAESGRLLEAGVDALAEGVLVLDASGKVARANPAARRILGRDLIGLSLPDWLACQGWLGADAVTPLSPHGLPPAAALRGEAAGDAEAYLPPGEGRRGAWVVLGARPLADPAGPAGAVVTVRDVTARKAERESGALYHSLMTSLALNVFRKDLQGRYTFVNLPFCNTLGKGPGDVLGRTDSDLFSDDLARVAREREAQVLETGGVVGYVEEHTPSRCQPGCRCLAFRDGAAAPGGDGDQCYFKMLLAPVEDAGGRVVGIQGVFWNITAHRLAERQLEQTAAALKLAVAELQRSNAELEQFAYVASHDLQEPLRMVASFTQLLQLRYRDRLDAQADEYIRFAVDGATRMQQLIKDLLAYSRVGSKGLEPRETSAEEAFDRAVQNLHEAIRECDALVTRRRLPWVKADPTQLAQLLQNLIGNALKFRRGPRPAVHVRARRSPDRTEWVFSVRDNGIGIAPQHRERIFVIFQRLHTREEYPGSGIGLAVCRKIVERHGGRIWVESAPGEGSTFYFTLPAG
jgi:signal transduction histidine kinase